MFWLGIGIGVGIVLAVCAIWYLVATAHVKGR